MVSGLPTPPEHSQHAEDDDSVQHRAASEEGSGAAGGAPSLSTMWQCSSATMWTLSPTSEGSQLRQAQYVSPLQAVGNCDGSITVLKVAEEEPALREQYNSQKGGISASEPLEAVTAQMPHQKQEGAAIEQCFLQCCSVSELSQADYADVLASSRILVSNDASVVHKADQPLLHPSAATPVAASITNRINCDSGSSDCTPGVSAYTELPDSVTICDSDAGTSPSPELSPLLVNFNHHQSSQPPKSQGQRSPHRAEQSGNVATPDDCPGKPDFKDNRSSSASGSSSIRPARRGTQDQQHVRLDNVVGGGWRGAYRLSGTSVSHHEATPVGRVRSSHSKLLSPPATEMSGAIDSVMPQFSGDLNDARASATVDAISTDLGDHFPGSHSSEDAGVGMSILPLALLFFCSA
jgi:hypothetical protein